MLPKKFHEKRIKTVWGMRYLLSDTVFDKCCKTNPTTEIFVILASARQ